MWNTPIGERNVNPRDMWLGEIVKCLRDRFGLTVDREDVDNFVREHCYGTNTGAAHIARHFYGETPEPNNVFSVALCNELRRSNQNASLIIAGLESALRSALALMSPEQIEEFGELDAMRPLRSANKAINRLFEPVKVEFPVAFHVPRNIDDAEADELNDALVEAMRAAALDVLKRDTRFKGVKYVEQ